MRVVVIDDNAADLKRYARALAANHSAHVLALDSLVENSECILKHNPTLILLDDRLGPLLTAEDSLKTIAKRMHPLPTVIMSSSLDPVRRTNLVRLGAIYCIEKDEIDAETLGLIVAMAHQSDRILTRHHKH